MPWRRPNYRAWQQILAGGHSERSEEPWWNNGAGQILRCAQNDGGRQEDLPHRSKERQAVEAEARSRLRASGYHQLRIVSCEFREGVLTLRGHVSTFYLKQVAQTLIRDLDGAGEINNRLEVAAPC
jgi:hypothetical protein